MNSGSPLVSVLVPTYNAAPYLAELCRSIQAQTHRNFEALILDDGSTDNTREVLAPFGKDPRFRLLGWQPNRGVNQATSAVLGLMKGDYWCNPGADDVLHPDFIAGRLELLESRMEAMMVHGPSDFIDASGRPARNPFRPLDLPARAESRRALAMLLQHNVISTPSVFVRSQATRSVIPYFLQDWKYAQDWYLWILHAATGFDVLWDARPLNSYRVHEQSLSLKPALSAVRRAEIALVPLCALSAAARFSALGAEFWSNWRKALYGAWLLRALKLRQEGVLQEQWTSLGARAYYGRNAPRVSLFRELCKHGWAAGYTKLKERRAARRQSFKVSGVAQINDPVFR